MAVTREKLYDEVWAEPMITVAKRYDVSSSFLGRVCKRLNVPRPPRGYWQQLAVGIEVDRPSLPNAEPGDELEWVRDGSPPRLRPMTATSPRKPRDKSKRPSQHPLLVGARAHFEHARSSRDNDYVRPYKRTLVDVFVSKEALPCALETASQLFLALEDRGQRVVLAPSDTRYRHVPCEPREGQKRENDYYSPQRWSPARPTLVFVGDVAIGLTLFEISEEVEARYDSKSGKYVRVELPKPPRKAATRSLISPFSTDWTTKHWMPSGRLGLHAYSPDHRVQWEECWREVKPGDMAGLFETIAKEFERAAPKIVKLAEEAEQRAKVERQKFDAQQKEWQRQEVERRRAQEEAQREKDIQEVIGRWRLARDVRAYVAETRGLVEEANLTITEEGALDRHLKWATSYAERIDPLHELRADIVKTVAEHDANCRTPPKETEAVATLDFDEPDPEADSRAR